jgi:hypothetical protein
MRTPLFWMFIFLGLTGSTRAADMPASLDTFHFLADLSVVGAQLGQIKPPQYESFFVRQANSVLPSCSSELHAPTTHAV